MDNITLTKTVPVRGSYDIIVAGGGVAGVAAAVSARRHGAKRVLLVEKTVNIGGLATTGLINFFVPMCNGRGKQIIFGMAEELLRESIKYGYDTLPEVWKNGEPKEPTKTRYLTHYSPWIFSMQLTELLRKEGVELLLDTLINDVVVEDNTVRGLVLESKSGTEFYAADYVVDATGDSDIFERAGAPTVTGQNYFTYVAHEVNLNSCKRAIEHSDIRHAIDHVHGGNANLYGGEHPAERPLYAGVTKEDVTEYVVENEMELLERYKTGERKSRELVRIPFMPQFRTTRHIKADYSLTMDDTYRHFDDSVGAINDFDHADRLFEIPYRAMINSDYPNLIAAGRCVSGEGFAWDILRVIPPAIISGQAAGVACVLAKQKSSAISEIDIPELQHMLAGDNVMIHFDDSLIPEDTKNSGESVDIGHI
ncbi:MAG: FAD-dependent oxidoreductase [Clostridia bacterium]|nr:FAD-dependent oxidoreductase [Clostridia bacterium]